MNTPKFPPIVVKGKKPITPLAAALKQLKKTDAEIGVNYLYLTVGPRKALRDAWLEMEAKTERLRATAQAFEAAHDWAAEEWMRALDRNVMLAIEIDKLRAELNAAATLLIECDALLSEVTK